MKRLVFVLAGFAGLLVLLLAGAVIFGPSLIPAGTLEREVEKQVSAALGREADVEPELKLAILPTPSVKTGPITIANAEGYNEPYLARIEAADIRVALWPLLARKVEIEAFILTKPDIRLETKADGSNNFTFETEAPSSDAPASAPQDAPDANALGDVSFGDVRIVDGALSLADGASGQTRRVEGLNAIFTLASLDSPFDLTADFTLDGEDADLSVRVDTPRDLIAGRATSLKGDISLGATTLNGAAKATLAEAGATASGTVVFETKSVRDLAAFAGAPIEAPNGFGPARLEGAFSADGKLFSFENAKFAFDDIAGSGFVRMDLSGDRPKATVRADLGDLDLRPYLTATTPSGDSDAAASNEFPAWSEEPIDVSALRMADLELQAKTDAILLEDLTIERSALKASLVNGRLTATLTDLGLYSGAGTADVALDARGATPTLNVRANLEGLDADAFAKEVMKLDRLSGTGALTATLSARGASEAAFVRSLNGTGSFRVDNGAVHGFDLGGAASEALQLIDQTNRQNATELRAAAGADRQTTFSALGGAFTAKDGLITLSEIAMKAERLSVVGAGTVNLPKQSTDIGLKAAYQRVVEGAAQGQRSVPLKVGGTFSKPTFGVDLKQAAKDTAANQIDRLLDKAVGGEANRGQGKTAEAVAGAAANLLLNRKKKTEEPEPAEPEKTDEETPPPAEDDGGGE